MDDWARIWQVHQNVQKTSPSLPTEEDFNHLMEIFPEKSWDTLKATLEVNGSFNKAVTTLLPDNILVDNDAEDDLMKFSIELSVLEDPDLQMELLKLEKKIFQGGKEKLKIDMKDLLNDAMAYYKDPNFDPRKKLPIVYRGQPAAGTGGVIRQFHTQLLDAICFSFFQGKIYRGSVYSCDMVASGVMKLVGTIIVHSILQGGPGVYNY